MKILVKLLTLASLVIFLSCGSDDGPSLVGTDISIADIAGNWSATSAVFDIATAGPSIRVDVVEEGGSVILQIQNNGRFTLTVTVMGRAPEVSTGQMGFDEDLLTVSFDDDPDDFEFFGIQHTVTTLSINGPAEFDFDGDGTQEPAIVGLIFIRS